MTAKPPPAESEQLTVTKADLKALKRCPPRRSFTYRDVILILHARHRLERLTERGFVEWEMRGEYPDWERVYRVTAKGREMLKEQQ